MIVLTADELRAAFSYCSETGLFVRLSTGRRAGTRKGNGYLHFDVNGRKYGAHRLAWLYVTGEWPAGDIDHIDGVRDNNRFSNLRDVSRTINLQNLRGAKSHNKSTGLLGSYFHKQTGRYTSRIRVNGKDRHLGMFATAQEAHAAYLAAKRSDHPGSML